MGIDATIVGPTRAASVIKAPGVNVGIPAPSGLVSVTTPLSVRTAAPRPFVNATYGVAMNQDAAFGGSPVRIHDGVDSVLWTGSNIIGTKFDDDNEGQKQAGDSSAHINNPQVGDIWEYNSLSTQDLTGFEVLSMYIYVDSDWLEDCIEIYGWDGSVEVGTRVALENYFDQNTFDVFHLLAIPLADMGLTGLTIESFRMQMVSRDGAKSPKIYIDEVILQQTGAPIEYHLQSPVTDHDYHVFRILLTMVDNVSSVVTNGTMSGLDYSTFLGVTAVNGMLVVLRKNDVILSAGVIKGIGDMAALGWKESLPMSTGSITQLTLEFEFPEPLVIRGNSESNRLSLFIRDDMTGLIRLTAHAVGATVNKLET